MSLQAIITRMSSSKHRFLTIIQVTSNTTQSIFPSILCTLLLSVIQLECTGIQEAKTVDSVFMDYDLERIPYHFNTPVATHTLHYDLEEISGLSYYQNGQLLAVQDESGTLFVISASDGKILQKVKFGKSGDYECLELLGDQLFVMKSNGDLYSWSFPGDGEVSPLKTNTPFTIDNDIEGMGAWDDKLLIVTKASGDIKGNKVKGKGGYFFDPLTGTLQTPEAFSIEKKDIDRFIENKKYFNSLNDFDPSAVSIHPISKDIYILSADRCIVIMDPKFEIVEVIKLDPKVYKQPEGICFSPQGTLYISSEGGGARGRLMEITYQIK